MSHNPELRQENFKQVKLFLLENSFLPLSIFASIDLLHCKSGKIRPVPQGGDLKKWRICLNNFSPCPVVSTVQFQMSLAFVG
jgi:hypothetical protein